MDDESIITWKSTRARRKSRRMKSQLEGQLVPALLGGLEDVTDTRSKNEWRTVDCPEIVRMLVNMQKVFARFVLEAASHEEAVGSLITL
jgi:hypothetical protein